MYLNKLIAIYINIMPKIINTCVRFISYNSFLLFCHLIHLNYVLDNLKLSIKQMLNLPNSNHQALSYIIYHFSILVNEIITIYIISFFVKNIIYKAQEVII